MDKYVRTAVIGLNEAEAFRGIKPFHSTSSQVRLLFILDHETIAEMPDFATVRRVALGHNAGVAPKSVGTCPIS